MAAHYLPKGVNAMRTSQPTIHKLATRRGQNGAHSTFPDLTSDAKQVTCKICLAKIAANPDRYPTYSR